MYLSEKTLESASPKRKRELMEQQSSSRNKSGPVYDAQFWTRKESRMKANKVAKLAMEETVEVVSEV